VEVMSYPKISVVTATYNAAHILPRLLSSLAGQSFRDFTVIIQDGSSTDNTVEVAESFRNLVPEIIIESSPDNGIYDAWNKALDNGGDNLGEWVVFLGADDSLADANVLAAVNAQLSQLSPDINFVSTEICWVVGERIMRDRHYAQLPDAFDNLWSGMTVPFPGLFIRSSLFAENRFNSEFKIAGDYDFLVRTWLKPEAMVTLPIMVAKFSLGGCSTKFSHGALNIAEKFKIREEYFHDRYRYRDFVFAHAELVLAGPKEMLRKQLMRWKWGQCLILGYKLIKTFLSNNWR
jgi:glycosyltransferase involved in cell wall biosynthesis